MKLLLWVGTSRIAGKGLFTAQAITRGSRIIQYTGEKITKAESNKRLAQGNNYIFQLNDRYDIDGKVRRNKARYINHSCAPNCDDAPAYPCTCRAETCCGFILAPPYQKVVKQQRASDRDV